MPEVEETCLLCGQVLQEGESEICEDCRDAGAFECAHCGEWRCGCEGCSTEDGLVCGDCLTDHYHECDNCGVVTAYELNAAYGGESLICDDCADNNYVACDRCGTYIRPRDTVQVESRNNVDTICPSCLEEQQDYGDVVSCEECGNYWYTNAMETVGGAWICPDCFENGNYDEREGEVRDYNYRPREFNYYGHSPDNLRFGLEIEMSKPRSNDFNGVSCVAERLPEAYCKYDGSIIGNDAFELVTHPCTLGYFKNEMDLRTALEELARGGYRSHSATGQSCGLHVHLSRMAFKSENHITRFVMFFEMYKDEMVKFSRRRMSSLDQWAAFTANYQKNDSLMEKFRELKRGKRSRYRSVNLTNGSTVEVRIFRGTLNYNTVMATVELLDAVYRYTKQIKLDCFWHSTWQDFVKFAIPGTDYLEDYLEKRELLKHKTQEAVPSGKKPLTLKFPSELEGMLAQVRQEEEEFRTNHPIIEAVSASPVVADTIWASIQGII